MYAINQDYFCRNEKGSVKIWELDRDNSDVKRDSFEESHTDELLDSLTPIGISSVHSCSAMLIVFWFIVAL